MVRDDSDFESGSMETVQRTGFLTLEERSDIATPTMEKDDP